MLYVHYICVFTVNITEGRQYILTGLRVYTNYTVRVRAYDDGHEPGPTSDNVTQETAQSGKYMYIIQ